MSAEAKDWGQNFLKRRELQHPDGRTLYAYRCTGQEFAALAETLNHSIPLGNHADNATVQAFVLYAAE